MAGHSKHNARRARRGFTLIELMVAMIISAIVMYGVYMIYERSMAAFRVQNQLVGLLENLRFGAEHLKRDVERAGFLATTNSGSDPAVTYNEGASPLLGIVVGWDDLPGGSASNNPNVKPCSLTLFSDFWSRGPLLVWRLNGKYLELDDRSYYGEAFPSFQELQAWFKTGRLVRIVNQSGFEMYHVVNGITEAGGGPNGTAPIIELAHAVTSAVGTTDGGISGFGTGIQVNPVGYFRYRIVSDTRTGEPNKHNLIREELDPTDRNTPMRNTQLVICEYAVDLQLYDFIFDDGTANAPSLSGIGNTTVFPNVTNVVSEGGAGRLGETGSPDPQRLRAVTVKLSVRTPDEDPNVTHRPRQNRWDKLNTFDVDPAHLGAARVRSVASRIVLENFRMRNLLPGASGP